MSIRLFTSWVRRGAAAHIEETDPISGHYPGPATFRPVITLARDEALQAPIHGPELPLLGPGAVIGLDAKIVVRTDPVPGATSVEDNYLVQVELARPDLPWLFTPAKPNAQNRLRPWLVLVVLEADKTKLEHGSPLPRISVTDSQLPDLSDSWGWVHAQVTVEDPAKAEEALRAPSGHGAVSRLLCPRRLSANTNYVACVVPATRAGVQAGLGLPLDPGPAIEMAWTVGTNQDVILPVYYSWMFTTSADGDFKSLVNRLRGVRADSINGFGTRTIDISSPWESPPQLGDGLTIELDGALRIGEAAPLNLPDEAQTNFETRLTRMLNFPAEQAPADSAGDPQLSAVAPPIYAGRHAGAPQVPETSGWLRTLNLDPRRRIAAAFGARYVREHQEFLMARAWDQIGEVQQANRLLALGEMASEVADRLHVRHVQTLEQSALFHLVAPARSRVRAQDAFTFQAAAATTPLPSGTATVGFRRLSRPLGPLGRKAFARTTPTLAKRGLAGDHKVRVIAPPVTVDGLAETRVANPLLTDATGRMAARAWQAVSMIEQAIPNPGDLTVLRKALDSGVQSGQQHGLKQRPPILIPIRPASKAIDPQEMASTLAQALLPSTNIFKRLKDRIRVPDSFGPGAFIQRIMTCPQFPAPLALALRQDHLEWLLPGLGNFPDDRVTLLEANPAFIEAFLAGVNHEMNRELLWREYPTDQRGTPFRHFWPRPNGDPDIPPITSWNRATPLGANGAANGPAAENMMILLVRGELLHRYPHTIVYAAPGRIDGKRLTLNTAVEWTAPQFLIKLDTKTTVFAYPLSRADVHSDVGNGKAGYYFVFSEPVSGARFNFDEPSGNLPANWADLDWDHVPQSRGFAVASASLPPPPQENGPHSPRWNSDAADIARIAFARPVRVGYHADELLGRI